MSELRLNSCFTNNFLTSKDTEKKSLAAVCSLKLHRNNYTVNLTIISSNFDHS